MPTQLSTRLLFRLDSNYPGADTCSRLGLRFSAQGSGRKADDRVEKVEHGAD